MFNPYLTALYALQEQAKKMKDQKMSCKSPIGDTEYENTNTSITKTVTTDGYTKRYVWDTVKHDWVDVTNEQKQEPKQPETTVDPGKPVTEEQPMTFETVADALKYLEKLQNEEAAFDAWKQEAREKYVKPEVTVADDIKDFDDESIDLGCGVALIGDNTFELQEFCGKTPVTTSAVLTFNESAENGMQCVGVNDNELVTILLYRWRRNQNVCDRLSQLAGEMSV